MNRNSVPEIPRIFPVSKKLSRRILNYYVNFADFQDQHFPPKEAAAQLLKKHLLFKNTCQIIVFKIRVITKIVCSFLFSKKIEEGSYFELFVKFPFFFFPRLEFFRQNTATL